MPTVLFRRLQDPTPAQARHFHGPQWRTEFSKEMPFDMTLEEAVDEIHSAILDGEAEPGFYAVQMQIGGRFTEHVEVGNVRH